MLYRYVSESTGSVKHLAYPRVLSAEVSTNGHFLKTKALQLFQPEVGTKREERCESIHKTEAATLDRPGSCWRWPFMDGAPVDLAETGSGNLRAQMPTWRSWS